MPGSAAVKSELAEWLAISESELAFPVEIVRASFENAVRLDPSNERTTKSGCLRGGTSTRAGWGLRDPFRCRGACFGVGRAALRYGGVRPATDNETKSAAVDLRSWRIISNYVREE